jgi:hypothetical protein
VLNIIKNPWLFSLSGEALSSIMRMPSLSVRGAVFISLYNPTAVILLFTFKQVCHFRESKGKNGEAKTEVGGAYRQNIRSPSFASCVSLGEQPIE